MRKRRETGNGRREYTFGLILTGKVTLLAIGVLLMQSCGTEQPQNTGDTTSHVIQSQENAPVKTLSVTPPNSPVPKQVADSIWNGEYIDRYPNGVIRIRGEVQAGLATGEWLTFYDDGKPYSRGHYRNGVRTGYGVSWYHDGQKSSEGYYNNGKTVGQWKYWSESTHQLMLKDYGGEMPDTTGAQ